MPNTRSVKKSLRTSLKKGAHNQMWKNRIKATVKVVKKTIEEKVSDPKIIAEQLSILQKTIDKATKEKVINKNRANRLKSKYANKTAKLVRTPEKKPTKSVKATATKK